MYFHSKKERKVEILNYWIVCYQNQQNYSNLTGAVGMGLVFFLKKNKEIFEKKESS